MISAVVIATVVIVFAVLLACRSVTYGSRLVIGNYQSSSRSSALLVFGFREICRTVLDPNIVTFLTQNAPKEVFVSFRVREEQLTRFSLQIASETLLRRFLYRRRQGLDGSSKSIEHLAARIADGFLLCMCSLGRASLWFLRCLSYGIPRRVHLWVPEKVLSGVAGMVRYFAFESGSEVMVSHSTEVVHTGLMQDSTLNEKVIADEVRVAISTALPNDLSRMICLATLRDNNTGGYYHPELARRFTIEAADRAMFVCHQEVYEHLVSSTLEDLTDQLETYFASTHSPKSRSIENWKKLRAYRATIPTDADSISSEILFMKIEVALAILEARVSTV